MAGRKKIALTYNYSENWIAGSYYVVNLIKALGQINDLEKPHIVLLYNTEEGLDLVKEANYPYISFVNRDINHGGFVKSTIRKLRNRFHEGNIFYKNALAGVNHIFEGSEDYPFIENHYYWVHDFQQLRLPQFFSQEDADNRSALPRKVATMDKATLILSSYDALNDFKTFFPGYKCKVKVWRFTSVLPDFSMVDFAEQCDKFNIHGPYFVCSNQFWQHKNHLVILEAIRILKEKRLSYQVVFTGKNFDFRNPGYYNELMDFISAHHLEAWTNFIGFIDRKVQLCLAQRAIGYIQPSFFEGWSTTVEDAKGLNQFVLLSNIPVHKEQLDYNVSFFDPSDAADLAEKMEVVLKSEARREKRDYHRNIVTFGNDILHTLIENETP